MHKFGYIINPRETKLYQVSGGFNKLKLHLPIIKDEVNRISAIYDKNNSYIGDILSTPWTKNEEELKEKLMNYMKKNKLDFICLGDAVKQFNGKIKHNRIITGIYAISYISVLYIDKYLREIFDKYIHEAEIVIAIDKYDSVTIEYIDYISSKANFIKLTGQNLETNESVLEDIYTQHGISINICDDYHKLTNNWDVFINLSTKLKLNILKKKQQEGIIVDPFFLVKEKTDYYKIINELGMITEDIIFFNKLNIVNNVYPPQLIESMTRRKYGWNTDNIYELLKSEIEENNYLLIE